jgi:hypothetical protein
MHAHIIKSLLHKQGSCTDTQQLGSACCSCAETCTHADHQPLGDMMHLPPDPAAHKNPP